MHYRAGYNPAFNLLWSPCCRHQAAKNNTNKRMLQQQYQQYQFRRNGYCYYSSNHKNNAKRNSKRKKSKARRSNFKSSSSLLSLSSPQKQRPRPTIVSSSPPTKTKIPLQEFFTWTSHPLKSLQTPGGKQFIFSASFYRGFNSTLAVATKRLPLYLILLYILQDEDLSPIPFTFDFMNGPSMLPTIYPTGECYVRLRNWPTWWGWIMSFGSDSGRSCTTKCNVGDIVAIKDYKGMYVCKRIIGIEGDKVWRYGEYAVELYNEEKGFGVPEITTRGVDENSGNGTGTGRNTTPELPSWEDSVEMIHLRDDSSLWTKVVVPQGHIWVEGDNPLFSIDSRHYGPVAMENVCGRIVYRLWPRVRKAKENKRQRQNADEHEHFERDSCLISRKRPQPITEDEMINGPYGVARVVNQNVKQL